MLMLPFYPYEYQLKSKKNDKVVNKVLTDSLKKSGEVVKFVMGSLPHVEDAILYADLTKEMDELEAHKL